MAAPIRFTITLRRGKCFEFRVYASLTEMRKACGVRDAYGCCETEPNARHLARIYLAADHVTVEFVAHECVHAAMATVKAEGRSPETEIGEEYMAYAAGILIARFWKRWEQIQRRRSAK